MYLLSKLFTVLWLRHEVSLPAFSAGVHTDRSLGTCGAAPPSHLSPCPTSAVRRWGRRWPRFCRQCGKRASRKYNLDGIWKIHYVYMYRHVLVRITPRLCRFDYSPTIVVVRGNRACVVNTNPCFFLFRELPAGGECWVLQFLILF